MSEKESIDVSPEDWGLPLTATTAEIKNAMTAMRAENAALKADVERWKDRAEENQRALMEARKDQAVKEELEARVVIAEAREARKITKGEEPFYMELYKANKTLCVKRLGELREQRYLENQQSLKGPFGDPPANPEAQFAARVAERMANGMNQAEAVIAVQKEDPELSQRVWGAEVARGAKKGGDE